MFRADVAVMRPLGLFLGKRQHFLRSLGKSLERVQLRLPPAGLVGRTPPQSRVGDLRSGPVTYYNARSWPQISPESVSFGLASSRPPDGCLPQSPSWCPRSSYPFQWTLMSFPAQ